MPAEQQPCHLHEPQDQHRHEEQQTPLRQAQVKQRPVDFDTIDRAIEHRAHCLPDRQVFKHVLQAGPAIPHLACRPVLQQDLPACGDGAQQRTAHARQPIKTKAGTPRFVKRGNQVDQGKRGEEQALYLA